MQKQFQLLYAPQTLDSERESWRPVVYLNVLKAVRDILDALDGDDETAYLSDRSNGESHRSRKAEIYQRQLYNLRLRLSPLLSLEETLSLNLAASGNGLASSLHGPLVRTGWQRAIRSRGSGSDLEEIVDDNDPYGHILKNEDVMGLLFRESAQHIHDLWTHPSVHTLIRRRRLRLEDSREL